MKKFKKLWFVLVLTLMFQGCSSIKEGFRSQKKNSTDEFLVEKKSPLVMPPNFNDLPEPITNQQSVKKENNPIKSLLQENDSLIDNDIIDFFVDTTPDKSNKFMPGKNIKILKYNKALFRNIDYIFLGAWNFKSEIFNKEKNYIKTGGKFITHIPNAKILKK